MALIKKFQDISRNLDVPIEFEQRGIFKKGKIRIIVINEDGSFREWFIKFPDSYVFNIRKKYYVLIPKCVIKGKYPLIIYYFNNPCPIEFKFEKSSISALDLRSQEQLAKISEEQKTILANVFLDAETINLAFTTRVMRGLYAKTGISPKVILIVAIVVFVMVLIILQVTGVVDVWGAISGKK